MALKRQLLTAEYTTYFQGPPETLPLQWETVETLLPLMAQDYPDYFTLRVTGQCWHWENRLLGCKEDFVLYDAASLPLAPLDWLGRQVQEDLLLMQDDPAKGMPLVAGQLCFPNDWCLADKIGQSFLLIHAPVPLFAEQIGRSSLQLLERLKVGRPVWRTNWGFKGSARLNLTPHFAAEQQESYREITAANIGARCRLRTERQTLSRLPRTRAVLFTVHTYQAPIMDEVEDREHVELMLMALQTMPDAMMRYKNILPFYQLLIDYLQEHL
jgi:hypothetical protein